MLSLCLLLALAAASSSASRPVILVHGLAFGYSTGMEKLLHIFEKESPETKVYLVKAHANDTSLTTPMWTQVNDTFEEIKMKLQSAQEGVTIICYSQGKKCWTGVLSFILMCLQEDWSVVESYKPFLIIIFTHSFLFRHL